MKFSVATATRNALPVLQRCVGSIRGQRGVEVEHLVQDACSSDGTPAWLADQSDLYGVSEADRGMYDAINRAWARSTGQILSWLNSDEQYLPGTLQLVADVFESNPDVDWVYGGYIVVDGAGAPIAARRDIRLNYAYISHGFLYAASCTLFFRRRLLDSGLLKFDDTLRYAADMDLVLRLLRAGAKWKRIDRYISLFGYDGGNLSCSPRMLEETELLRLRHGASTSALKRRAYWAGRAVERLATGCYLPARIRYDFATDAVPSYRSVGSQLVSFRYRTEQRTAGS